MEFSIVFSSDINGGIGCKIQEGKDIEIISEYALPWYCSTDLKFFKNLTINNTVIMGKNTFDSLPKFNNDQKEQDKIQAGLSNRINIVLTSQNIKNNYSNVYFANNIQDVFTYCQNNNLNNLFVIGGANIFKQFMSSPFLKYIYWNIIPERYIKHQPNIFSPINFIELSNKHNYEKTFIDDIVCYKFINKDFINYKNNNDNQSSNHEEMQYLNICKKILNEGVLQKGRNGFTKSIFGTSMRFSLENGKIPIFTTKKVAWKTCLKELLWFISGDNSDNTVLQKQNVHIWDGNSTREYLDLIGLTDYEENELGKIYGEQWRHFNQTYIPKKYREQAEQLGYDNTKGIEQICNDIDKIQSSINNETNIDIKEIQNEIYNLKNKVEFMSTFQPKQNIDQLQYIIDCLKDPVKRYDRRLIMSAWNPSQFHQMALPPCHAFCQFYVGEGDKLSCLLMCRSQDEFLGTPINISSYSFLTHLIAKHCSLEPFEFIIIGGNCHIYDDHFEQVEEQLKRKPHKFPTLEIQNIKENINDYILSDFKINDYTYHPQIKAVMRA